MKNLLFFSALLLVACSPKSESFTLKNTTGKNRIDESFMLSRAQLQPSSSTLMPVIRDDKGELIPSQLDDLDGDGMWDELSFVYSLRPLQKAIVSVHWVTENNYPEFKPRTNVRLGKMFSPGDIRILSSDIHYKYNLPRDPDTYPYQTDGPAWENDKVAFRHYFDGRNVRDVFGKLTSEMVMDTVGIKQNGHPGDTYHVLSEWGRDIMSASNSFGLGGIAILHNDSLVRLGVTVDNTIDNIDSTKYTLISKGPVRSMFRLDYYGWDIGGCKVDMSQQITIWAGKYGYENRVITSRLPENASLITGIVNNLNNQPYITHRIGNYHIMATHDKQTYNKEWFLGMGLLIPDGNFTNRYEEVPGNSSELGSIWYTLLTPNETGEYYYNCFAAWELSDNSFTQRDCFVQLLNNYSEEFSFPSVVGID